MRNTEQTNTSINAILNPRSIAFIGASDNIDKWGGVLLHLAQKFRYAGAIFPINPKSDSIQGLPAFRSILDVPEPIDLAVITINAHSVEQAILECASHGVRAVMVVTAQFAETGAEGARMQARILEITRRAGIAMIGPNCMGVLNANQNLALLNSTALLESFTEIPRGRIGVVSQSGAIVGAMIARAGHVGAGFSSCVTLGNQADLEICDFFDYLVDDPDTDVICLYMESASSAERLFSIAQRARQAGKPVLITKAGRTQQGAQAVASHTASMAGTYDTFVSRCQDAGILVQTDPLQMLLTAQTILSFPPPPATGIAFFSASGGAGALASDALSDHGLHPAELSEATRTALAEFFTPSNQQLPYDMGTAVVGPAKSRPDLTQASMEPIFAEPAVGTCIYVMTPQWTMTEVARIFTQLGRKHGKPALVVNSASGITESMRLALLELGVPFFPSLHEALLTVRDLQWLHAYTGPGKVETSTLPPELLSYTSTLGPGLLHEDQAKKLLSLAGIDVAAGQLATTAEQAILLAEAIGYPVVLKIVAEGVTHKSDMGGVQLDLANAEAVRQAFADIRQAAAQQPAGTFIGCLVQPMLSGDAELMVGSLYDEQFGAFLMIGAGGTLVELMKDTKLLPAPASVEAIEKAIRGLQIFPLLNGYRGRKPANITAIAETAHRVSVVAAALGARMPELDINPLAISGDRSVALDARARWVPATASHH